jgi:hypothetical protein
MSNFWYLFLSFLQGLSEFFGWWIAFGVIWYSFEPALGTKAVLVTGFAALACFVSIRILLNRLY